MTDEEIRAAYLELIKGYCNNNFIVDDIEVIPAPVNLAVDKLMEMDSVNPNLKSQTEGGIAASYHESLPPKIKMMIAPYRKLAW
ncbi:hypothetical protein [Halocella sp. SP3-1]|uniref:hypothetical protein n=1 Tax=Halocella sp. SP3-1 TaxID=2382161 RepID=UPI000F751110|nr:hypothetical protein [Halocella sp. SP3-1]AZO96137.1 hypothetical protein D7D81_16925 [Halocella sp. SP3-1]